MATFMTCKKCGKELSKSGREHADRINKPQCVECSYMESIGVETIEDYNNYLRDDKKHV